MRIDVVTIFPELIEDFSERSILGRARREDLIEVRTHDPRDHTTDAHRSVDDAPFGGGAGMVLRPEPLLACLAAAAPPRPVLALTPAGERFDQRRARELAATEGFTLLCGRYEGIDQRVIDHACDGELSVGDVVLAGGEVAALVVIEAVSRLVPGVMGNEASSDEESFGAEGLLEHPQYTRPAELGEWAVPQVLRSGDHDRIRRWKRAQSLLRTAQRRPELLPAIDAQDRAVLDELGLLETFEAALAPR